MEKSFYVQHDSDNCECCLDFWGASDPQAKDKELLESDTDSGYGSVTTPKDALHRPGSSRTSTSTSTFTPATANIVPRIIVTPLSDDEQLEHNACIRAALLQRNAFAPYNTMTTTTTTNTPSLTSLSQQEKALPSSSAAAARSTASLPATFHSSCTRPFLRPPEESWAHRLKDTYENRMDYPQYFDITPRSPATAVTPTLRKKPSKDIELHPAALGPTTRQSIRKRWSISGSGVGFGFGTTAATATTASVAAAPAPVKPIQTTRRTVADPNKTTPTPRSKDKEQDSPNPAEPATLKRRARVSSTRSLDKSSSSTSSSRSSSPSPSPPTSRPTSMILTSSSGNARGGGATGAFGKGVQGVRSFIGRYSNAPSSFRML